MEPNEHEEVVAALQARLREHGLGSIANIGDVVHDPERDEYRATPARDRLILMLTAFERHLAQRDAATLDAALERINAALDDGRVDGALFDPFSGVAGDLRSLRIGSVRRPLRDRVAELVSRIHDD